MSPKRRTNKRAKVRGKAAARKKPRTRAAKKAAPPSPRKRTSAGAARKKTPTRARAAPATARASARTALPAAAVGAETLEEKKLRARRIVRKLHELYPGATTALQHRDAFELLVATILSAQCTDERVNQVTPALFRKYRTPADFARARQEDLEAIIHPTGFFRQKARTLVALGQALEARFGGQVPRTLEEFVTLPGVGRKTANVVLGTSFGIPGIVVDTHVARLAGRLGLSDRTDPEKIELDLMEALPREEWTFASHALIWHGRKVCQARKPRCPSCGLAPDCPYPHKTPA